jgi:hypothetical protein
VDLRQLKRRMRITLSRCSNPSIVLRKCSRSHPGNIYSGTNSRRRTSVYTSPLYASIPSTFNISNVISELSDTSSLELVSCANYSYPKLNAWMKHLYWQVPGFKETTDFTHIKRHYMMSHPSVTTDKYLTDYRSIRTELSVQVPFLTSSRCSHGNTLGVENINGL